MEVNITPSQANQVALAAEVGKENTYVSHGEVTEAIAALREAAAKELAKDTPA